MVARLAARRSRRSPAGRMFDAVPADTERLNTALAGRYRIERHLGAGGMATVFLAEDLKHKRKVALKVLKPELAAVLGAERFVQEITTTASLQHPHILALFDSGTADGFLFYVMPWIQGETLREKLNRETQLGVDEAVRIAREVLDALEYAHQHGIVHRDIKPENILLHGGHAMVADFGIALAVSAAAGGRMTETGLSLGTPHYMSPEQATAEKEITARSDVYSLGSVLYEMLTGQPPHLGGSAQQIIMRIITDSPRPVAEIRKSVPANVAAAVAKSLEKLPADRFDSAKAFSEALGSPAYTNAALTGAVSPTPARSRRQRVRDAVFVGTLVAAVAVPTGWWLSERMADAPIAVHFALSTAPSQPLGLTLGRTLALSPDGRVLVYATTDSAGRQQLFKRELDDLQQQPIAGTDEATHPFFSPDGRSLGFFDAHQLKKISLDGGTATSLTDLPSMQGASWGPSGIVVSAGGKLMLVPSSGGVPVALTPGDSASGYWPVMLPDGKAVVYATTTIMRSAQLAVAVLSTGRTSNLGIPGRSAVGVVGGELIFERNDGSLMAIPFDVGARRVTGSARAVAAEAAMNPTGEVKAAISASGSLAYVRGGARAQVVVVDMRGVARPLAIPPARLASPRYSPDGRRIVADLSSGGRTDVWIYDVASGAAHRVTTEGASNARPEWTPDGTRVLFRSDRKGRNTTLWWQPADGSGGAQELLASPGKDVWEGVFTPDSHAIVYRTGAAGTADIWYRRVAGDTTPHGIATTPFSEYAPKVSADGRWVAYESSESGSAQVVVRPFPGPGAQFPVSVGGGTTPVWSRDGRRIFYANGNKLLVASVATNPTFSVSAREVLFETNYEIVGTLLGHANFDVSPDGSSFLMLRSEVANRDEIIVIPNWKAELRAQGKSTGRP
jgi:serine/threonine-protein kinase